MNKGFTIKELFIAIILIGILFAVCTLILIKFLENTEKKSFKENTYSLVNAVKAYQLENSKNKLKPITIDLEDVPSDFDFHGTLPDSGKIKIDKKGKVKLEVWSSDTETCLVKTKKEKKIQILSGKSKKTCTLK